MKKIFDDFLTQLLSSKKENLTVFNPVVELQKLQPDTDDRPEKAEAFMRDFFSRHNIIDIHLTQVALSETKLGVKTTTVTAKINDLHCTVILAEPKESNPIVLWRVSSDSNNPPGLELSNQDDKPTVTIGGLSFSDGNPSEMGLIDELKLDIYADFPEAKSNWSTANLQPGEPGIWQFHLLHLAPTSDKSRLANEASGRLETEYGTELYSCMKAAAKPGRALEFMTNTVHNIPR